MDQLEHGFYADFKEMGLCRSLLILHSQGSSAIAFKHRPFKHRHSVVLQATIVSAALQHFQGDAVIPAEPHNAPD